MSVWQFWYQDGPREPKGVRGSSPGAAALRVALFLEAAELAGPGSRFVVGVPMIERRVNIWAPHVYVLDEDMSPVQEWPQRRMVKA